jgi:hypothetical protein BACCOPRO_03215
MREIGEVAMAQGWESYVAYSRGRDGEMQSSSKTIPVGSRFDVARHGLYTRLTDRHGLASSAATRRFITEIERLDPDIVHIHNIHGYFLNYRLLFDYLARSNRRVVWTVHDCWLYTGHCYYYSFAGCDRWQSGCGKCPQRSAFPKSWLFDRSAQNWLDKRQAFTSLPKERFVIVPVSDWIREEMRKSFLKDCDFRVIHNGIDLDVFRPLPDVEEVKEKYGLSQYKTIILGLASIWSKEKGLDDFITMSRRVTSAERIVLVGVDDKTRKRLPENITAIRRTDNVEELARLYAAATAFVNPTWQDNYPTVNLESIACGTPVVTYHTGGSIEAVTPATGRIVEQGDVAGLFASVRDISARGKESYAAQCRAFAEANFRKQDRYRDYLRLYRELLNNV